MAEQEVKQGTKPRPEPSGSAKRLLGWIKRFGRNEQVVLSTMALVVGIAAGLAAIGFRTGIDVVQSLFYGVGGERLATVAGWLPWWQVILAPTVGGLVVGLLVYVGMPGRRPHGVADVIEANALHGGRMSLTTGLRAAVVSALSLGCGASAGREGPVVHLGASLGSWVAKRLHLGRRLSRTLLGCGVAAGVAASFNAPIAGAFFALEVVIGHYALSAFAPIVIAAVTGTIVSRMHYGDYPAFILTGDWAIASLWEFPAFALLGVVSAVAAIVFMRSVIFTEDIIKRIPAPPWSWPAAGGLLVGVIAVAFPEVLGVGYEATDAALQELYDLEVLLVLIVAKTAATAITLACRFGGGVFSPSLFIGAMVGGAFGLIATSAFPHLSSGHGAYTLIGMGAVAGAVLGAPISTILMIFELTTDYRLTIAVMIATAIASLITQQVFGRSFFTWQLERRGIRVKGGQDIGLLRTIKVGAVMDNRYETIAPEAPITQVRERLQEAPWGELFVVDADRRLTGTITFSDLHEAAFDTSHDDELQAQSVAREHPTVLHIDDDLERAVKVYGASGEPHLPVVDGNGQMRLLGIAHEHEVFLAYHRALDQTRAEERGEL
ncbi:MAG: chloride channel protein [Kiloniellales bacterium]|nr:chloride channel protein [Kiloniellales bacterium]